jgi:hypothetical protein
MRKIALSMTKIALSMTKPYFINERDIPTMSFHLTNLFLFIIVVVISLALFSDKQIYMLKKQLLYCMATIQNDKILRPTAKGCPKSTIQSAFYSFKCSLDSCICTSYSFKPLGLYFAILHEH